jgi:hypothetical protein
MGPEVSFADVEHVDGTPLGSSTTTSDLIWTGDEWAAAIHDLATSTTLIVRICPAVPAL